MAPDAAACPAPARYNRVALSLHWLVAALVVAVAALGIAIPEAPLGSASRAQILLWHRSIGLTILAVTVFRILWRWRHPPPPLPSSLAPAEVFLAYANHYGLYALLLGMPLVGYISAAAAGHGVSLFGLVSIPPLIGESGRLSQIAIALHLAGQFLLYLLVATHVVAALVHAIIRRDGVFGRILPAGRPR